MIEVEKLTKYFGSFPAVKEISFTVEKGEIIGFLGPNGSGKTTTLRILTGFLSPTSGKVKVAGFDVLKDSLEVRRRIGYLPENVPLYPDMRVSTYLNFVASVKGMGRNIKKKMITEVMDNCGILEVSSQFIGKLSKGYRQRVGFAQALINDPEVLILDEPTLGLDPKQIIEIRELIKTLAGKRTIILSTHILPDISKTCQRVIVIYEGELVAIDTIENLANKFLDSSWILLQVEGPSNEILRELSKVPGVLQVRKEKEITPFVSSYMVECTKCPDNSKGLSLAVYKNNWKLLEMRPLNLELEDIFIKLVTNKTLVPIQGANKLKL